PRHALVLAQRRVGCVELLDGLGVRVLLHPCDEALQRLDKGHAEWMSRERRASRQSSSFTGYREAYEGLHSTRMVQGRRNPLHDGLFPCDRPSSLASSPPAPLAARPTRYRKRRTRRWSRSTPRRRRRASTPDRSSPPGTPSTASPSTARGRCTTWSVST